MNDEIKPQRKIIKFLVITLVVIFIVFFYARNIATTIISIKEYPIKNNNLPQNFNGLKIVQFSDIEYNSTTNLRTIKKVVKKINYLEPDIVIYTGDLINSSSNLSKEDITSIAKELNKIDVSINKYAIIGDDDYSDVNTYLKIMNDANFKVLDNQNELIFNNGNEPILLVGLSSKIDTNKAFDESAYNSIEYHYKIVAMHEPDNITKLKDYNINLALAGHSLGGQIKLPFIKGIIKFKGSKKYLNDYYKVNTTNLYINNGIGTKKTKLRFLNNPTISLYRFYK